MKTKMAHKLLAHESMCVLMWCLQMIFIVRSIGGSSSLVCECSKFCSIADLFREKSERNEIGYHFFSSFFLKTSQSSIKSKATFLSQPSPAHTHTHTFVCMQTVSQRLCFCSKLCIKRERVSSTIMFNLSLPFVQFLPPLVSWCTV